MQKKEAKIIRAVGIMLFIIYLAGMVYFLFFAEGLGRMSHSREYSYNLKPFKEIGRFIKYRKELGLMAVTMNLLGNIICFVPYGLFLPVINKKTRNGFKIALLSLDFSLIVEILQLIFKVGSFDVDDLILNTIGGVTGFIIFYYANELRRKYYGKKNKH